MVGGGSLGSVCRQSGAAMQVALGGVRGSGGVPRTRGEDLAQLMAPRVIRQVRLQHAERHRWVPGPVGTSMRECFPSNVTIGAKDHASTQRNVAEVDKLTGRFNGQLKTDPLCGALAGPVSHMTPFSNWPRLMASSQRTADWRTLWVCSICHK
jgi:hypothetical protein